MSSSPYAPAARLVNQVLTERKGLKSLAYNSKGELTCSKTVYAQSSHVLQHKKLLKKLAKEVPDVQAKNSGLLYVLLYELLLGPNKSIRGGGALKRQLLTHEETLRAKLKDLQLEFPTENHQFDHTRIAIPRYVRINTAKASFENVLQELQQVIESVYIDQHIPNVVVLPPTSSTRANLQELMQSNQIVLQDKSSCFSALCLVSGFSSALPPNCEYLDACAAPGNKTSHLASLVPATARVHAFDKSKDRFQLLQRRMKELVGPKVECHQLDFLEASSTDSKFSKVRAILLDPSCSGSGMIGNHQEASRDPNYCNDRIRSLSDFQLKALQHATSSFKDVERVVYSTCSLYTQENEGVVQRFLSASSEWSLVAPQCLSSWNRRGLQVEGLTTEQANALIRVHPDEDATNGFFVACFERKCETNGKKKALSKLRWSMPSLPKGLEYYKNQFHDSSAKEDGKGPLMNSKESSSSKDEMNKESTNKRKSPDSASEALSHAKDSPEIVSKKRAKKMEWKRSQRKKKLQRLEKKQKVGKP